jgi:hypothetical protein
VFAAYSIGILELSLGNYEAAAGWLGRVCENDGPLAASALPDLVEAAVRACRYDTAESALGRLTERARASGTALALGLLARAQALLADHDAARDRYEEAIAQLGRSRSVPPNWPGPTCSTASGYAGSADGGKRVTSCAPRTTCSRRGPSYPSPDPGARRALKPRRGRRPHAASPGFPSSRLLDGVPPMPEKTPASVPRGPVGLVPRSVLTHPATARFLDAVIVDAGLDVDQEKAVAIALLAVQHFENGQGAQVFEACRAAGFGDADLDVLIGAAVSCYCPRWLDSGADLPEGVEFSFAFAPELRP